MCLQFKWEVFCFLLFRSVGVNCSGRNRPCNLVCSAKFKVLCVTVTEVWAWDPVSGKKLSVSSAQFQIALTSHPLRSFPTMAFHDSLDSQSGAYPKARASWRSKTGEKQDNHLLSVLIIAFGRILQRSHLKPYWETPLWKRFGIFTCHHHTQPAPLLQTV